MKIFISAFLCGFLSLVTFGQSFKEDQKDYPRVRKAYVDKGSSVRELCETHNLEIASLSIYLRAFKEEETLELWGKDDDSKKFVLLEEYPFCSSSGSIGPKRKQGDYQIPEGFYHIDRFNPSSSFYLSLGINYPNRSDRILGDPSNPGGDIFIHGSCVTIGCIPITDPLIKELYVFAIEASNNGQRRIPVTIFPARLTADKYTELKRTHASKEDWILLWTALRTAYDFFDKNQQLPGITVRSDGQYQIN